MSRRSSTATPTPARAARAAPAAGDGDALPGSVNAVLVRGQLAADAQRRDLASGAVQLSADVVTGDGTTRATVPVVWFDPPPGSWAAGDDVVVCGAVRRRFFRVGAATQSRTEVVVATMAPADRRTARRAARRWLAEQLEPSRARSKR
jgi:hypothetical protein